MHSSLENGESIMRSLKKHTTDRNCIIGLISLEYRYMTEVLIFLFSFLDDGADL